MAANVKRNPDPGMLVQFSRTLQLVWRLMNDPRVPILPKLIIPGVIVYFLSPIDLIPELFIPIVGEVDDIAVIFLGIRFFIEMCPPHVVLEHRRALEGDGGGARDDYVDGTYRVVDDDKGT